MDSLAYSSKMVRRAVTTSAFALTPDSALNAPVPLWVRPILLAVSKAWSVGHLRINTPKGQTLVLSGTRDGACGIMNIHNWGMLRRVAATGDIGLAEAYRDEQWSTPDLGQTLTALCANVDAMKTISRGRGLKRWIGRLRHALHRNTKSGSKANIHAHYDLGNDFYSLWLDETMTYSAARHRDDDRSLEAAQDAKYRRLAEQMRLKPGMHVLEIGCGWGGFSEFMAREYGVRVTAVTISAAQYAYARDRIAAAGLSDQVDIQFRDYRDITGQFDAVGSVEMFEAVGEAYWPTYFRKIREVLKPGAAAALQIITIRDDLFAGYKAREDFIQKYIFPGGMLPSAERLNAVTAQANLAVADWDAFGLDYAQTLRAWDQNVQAVAEPLAAMGYDPRFQRLWRFYLCYCEAGFRTHRTDVVQLTLQ